MCYCCQKLENCWFHGLSRKFGLSGTLAPRTLWQICLIQSITNNQSHDKWWEADLSGERPIWVVRGRIRTLLYTASLTFSCDHSYLDQMCYKSLISCSNVIHHGKLAVKSTAIYIANICKKAIWKPIAHRWWSRTYIHVGHRVSPGGHRDMGAVSGDSNMPQQQCVRDFVSLMTHWCHINFFHLPIHHSLWTQKQTARESTTFTCLLAVKVKVNSYVYITP